MKRIITLMIFCLFAGMVLNGQALKVDATGNVGLDTGTPLFKLHVMDDQSFMSSFDGTAANFTRVIVNSANAVNSGLQFRTQGNANWSTAAFQANTGLIDYVFWNDQLGQAAINVNGDNNNTDFGGTVSSQGTLLTSDKRFKKNIKSYEGGLEKVMKIRPVKFNYKSQNDNDTYIGVIAQELQKVDKDLVRVDNVSQIDEDMNIVGSKEVMKIQSDAVQYMLVSAIQEQQELIIDLQAQIEDLKAINSKEINNIDVTLTEIGSATLMQNTPNPFNETTEISYTIPTNATNASISFFSLQGQLMKTVDITHKGQGSIKLASTGLASGMYTYSLSIDSKVIDTKKMLLSN